MATALSVIMLIFVSFGLMTALGILFWLKRKRVGVIALMITCVALTWWAGHYYNALPAYPEGDELWHKRYMVCILGLAPATVLFSALIGYRLRMREYMRQHHALPETGGRDSFGPDEA